MNWSFVFGFMIAPATVGLILLLANLAMCGYIGRPDPLSLYAGCTVGTAVIVTLMWLFIRVA